jgi:hypothetical protein
MSEKPKFTKRLAGFVSHFVNAFVPEKEDKNKDIWAYGSDDKLPNRLLSIIADSGVATRCVSKLTEYIASDGFTEPKSASLQVNPKQTADELLQEQANYAAYFGGAAFHIKRKANGEIGEVSAIPFQCVRKKVTSGYLVNLTYGQPKFDRTKEKIYPEFKGVKISPEELKEVPNGEILYVYRKTAANAQYPVPDYYAGIEDIQTSAEVSKYDLETVVNGFATSGILTLVGDIDDESKDENGKTELQYIQDRLREFTGQVKNENGLGGRNRLLVQYAKTKEEVPVLQQYDAKSILEASNSKRDVIGRAVCYLFGTHPVLMGYSEAAVLGNTQAIANASIELNKLVNPLQRMLTNAFKMLFPTMEWNISEYMPIQYIDPALYADMTQDERRNKFLGLEPIETDAGGEADKTIKAINSLSPLVANKVLESLTADKIRGLVNLPPAEPENTPTNGATN